MANGFKKFAPQTDSEKEKAGTPHTQKGSRGSLMSSAMTILKAREQIKQRKLEEEDFGTGS